MSQASRTPLTTVIDALFEAISITQSSQTTSKPYPAGDPSYQLLHRFIEISSYFPPTLVHAHASGPLAGPRALQMTIRKTSVWMPIGFNPDTPSPQLSMVDEMERIAFDRQRRKDYIQWARVHAAAMELGMLSVNGDSNNQLVSGRSFSEVMAKDSVWQDDEVEWCAGIFILRAIIRTGLRGGPGQMQEYEEILRVYEGRWKEIKDEARQALVTVCPVNLPFQFCSGLTNLTGGFTGCQRRPRKPPQVGMILMYYLLRFLGPGGIRIRLSHTSHSACDVHSPQHDQHSVGHEVMGVKLVLFHKGIHLTTYVQ